MEADVESLAEIQYSRLQMGLQFPCKVYKKNNFGSSSGADVFRKVKEDIAEHNRERGKELAKAKQTTASETIIAICDEFNQRVHENIPAAGDLLIMDATANSKLFT